jgi:type I restriction enzyme S subunit
MKRNQNSKQITTTFAKSRKDIPELRFKEFDNYWEVSKLGDYCTFSQGIQVDVELQSREPKEGYVKFLRIENYTQKSQDFRYIPLEVAGEKRIKEDEIAIVRYGATAGFISKGFDGVLANNLFKVIPDEERFTLPFLFEYLNSHKAFSFFQSEMSGGAMPALSFGIVKGGF